jgi:hypothetical protein
MTELPEPLRLSRGKRAPSRAIHHLLLTLVALRYGGDRRPGPRVPAVDEAVLPGTGVAGGKLSARDPVLGYGHLPGAYTVALADVK